MNSAASHHYYISVGSNVADAGRCVGRALIYLCQTLTDCQCSCLYSTSPLGGKPVPDYVNAVACGFSALTPDELNATLKAYETAQGRTKEDSRAGHVVIDLDIVIADGEVLRSRDFEARHFQIGYKELNQEQE